MGQSDIGYDRRYSWPNPAIIRRAIVLSWKITTRLLRFRVFSLRLRERTENRCGFFIPIEARRWLASASTTKTERWSNFFRPTKPTKPRHYWGLEPLFLFPIGMAFGINPF